MEPMAELCVTEQGEEYRQRRRCRVGVRIAPGMRFNAWVVRCRILPCHKGRTVDLDGSHRGVSGNRGLAVDHRSQVYKVAFEHLTALIGPENDAAFGDDFEIICRRGGTADLKRYRNQCVAPLERM